MLSIDSQQDYMIINELKNRFKKVNNKYLNYLGLILILFVVVIYVFLLWKNKEDNLNETGGVSSSGEYTFSKRVSNTSALDIEKAKYTIQSFPENSEIIYNTAQIMTSYGGVVEFVNLEANPNSEYSSLTLKIKTTDEAELEYSKVFNYQDTQKLELYRRTENGPISLKPSDIKIGQTINITEVIYLLSGKTDLLIIDIE